MNKKLLSLILSVLLLGKTSQVLPIKAANEKKSDTITSKAESANAESIKDFILDTLSDIYLFFLGYGIFHYVNSGDSEDQNKKPQDEQNQTHQQPETSKKSKAEPMQSNVSEKPKTTVRSRRQAVHPQRMVIEDLQNNQVACSTPIPLRSIAWHGNRCWFHASLLHFYHNSFYHNPVLEFPAQEAKRLQSSGNLNDRERAILEAMESLSEIFRVLQGDINSPDYNKPQVVFLGAERENDLIAKLARFNNLFSAQPAEETLQSRCNSQNACTAVIDELLKEAASYARGHADSPQLQHWFNNSAVFRMRSNEIPNEAPLKYVGPGGYHFWIEIENNGKIFEIGRSTTPCCSIAIKSSNADKPLK